MKSLSKPAAPGLASVVLACLLTLSACGVPTEAELLASARTALASHKPDAARLALKTLVQAHPKSSEGRLLLGKLMHDSGEMAGAEAELRRALALGQPEANVMPTLASSLIALGQGALLLQQFGQLSLPEPQADAGLKTQLALAEATDGQLDKASARLGQALRSAPDFAPALLLQARLAAAKGDTADAMTQAEALTARLPTYADAWMLKGELLLRAGGDPATQRDAAMAAYLQVLQIKPDSVAAHSALISLQLAKADLAAATRQWTALQLAAPQHRQTLFFEAVLAEQKGDAKRTRELMQLLLRGAPENPQFLTLAAQAEIKLNAPSQAEVLLLKAMKAQPKAPAPRRLLASVQWRSGQSDKALATLKPLLETKPPDAQALTLSAQVHLLRGETAAADTAFAQAVKLQPDDTRLRTAMALSSLAKGQDVTALNELQSIAADDKSTIADLALISARLRRNDLPGALKAVDALAIKLPGDALPDQLRGRIALQRKDFAGARQSFEAALTKNADDLPALSGLASLDLADKQPAAAKARFTSLLRRQPKHAGAMLALADIGLRTGAPHEETIAWLTQAIEAEPSAAKPRWLLADLQLSSGKTAQALAVAQAGVTALPDDPALLDRLGRAQFANGQVQQAVVSFSKLAALAPKSALPQLRLADAHAAASNRPALAAAVKRAAEIDGNSLPVQQAQIKLAMLNDKPDQALGVARRVQSQRADQAVGFRLEADIEIGRKQWDAAAIALRKAIARQQPGDSATRLHGLLLAGKKAAEADKLADEWRRSHPDDLGFLLHLGDTALANNNPGGAEPQYRRVLDRQPDNVLALNNLAYSMALQKKPGALALTERAQQISPNVPTLMDTLAFCLAAEGQLPRAVEVQTRVVAAEPKAAPFRLQLAKLLLKSGNMPGARTELNTLAKLGAGFDRQTEVAEMLKSLGG